MPAELPLAAVSLTWREAPTAVRDRGAIPLDEARWQALRAHGVRGLIALHTCARSLWVIDAESPAWVGALWQAQVAGLTGVNPPLRTGSDAARFVLRVAVGLDSHMQGEADIGRQFARAVTDARAAGRVSGILGTIGREAASLVSLGSHHGWVRPNRGVGSLAVEDLRSRGLPLNATVGVIGAGAIGHRVVASLRRAGFAEPVVYNRSPKPGTRPLSECRGHPAVVVCTAGPARSLKVEAPLVLDLGAPPQVDGPAIGLDALLSGEGLKLDAEHLAASEAAVEAAVLHLVAEEEARRWRRRLGGVRALRDRFLDDELERLLGEAVHDLAEGDRRRILAAARGAIRRYDHEIVTLLRDEGERA